MIGGFIETLSGEALLGIVAALPGMLLAGSDGVVGEIGVSSGGAFDGGVGMGLWVGLCRLGVLQVVLLQVLLVVIQLLWSILWDLGLLRSPIDWLRGLLIEVVIDVESFLHEL